MHSTDKTAAILRDLFRKTLILVPTGNSQAAEVRGVRKAAITEPKIIVSIMSFNLLWIFVDVYQMATVANTDHSGAFAALIPGAQGLGQIVGPNLAASILAASWGYTGVFLLCGAAALTGMAVYAVMYLRLRATIPALADAS